MTIKKITSLLILSVLPLGVLTAQEDKDYLPKAGDLAIGIDMQPVYSFFGNLANGDAGNGLGQFGGEDPFGITGISIMGKYMLDNTTALRVNVGINKNVTKTYSYSIDDEARFLNPLSEAKVQDLNKFNSAGYSLAAGIEFRKGKNRIQGFLGGDVVFAVDKERYQFSYGNVLTDVNQIPSRTAYNNVPAGFPSAPAIANVGYWTRTYATESYACTVLAGVAGRLGVEYFIVPQLSFGGEVSLMVAKRFEKGSYTKAEGYNPTTAQVETHTELMRPASSQFHIGTENLGGKLFMMFYF
ncbi:MAG: hypothetical protein IKJ66_07525 [Bacteroidaceae bacterium]|nr:hypothetical protein [Bacteroidaceae bacterium]